ncbi:MAG: response regulator [Candidatus Moraniibacteriota bacterium]
MKILYIDDTAYWRELYEETFTKAGIEIKTLPDARGNIVKDVLEYKPDLILLDISMPEVNGFEAINILKDDEKTKNIPVFFFSNISDSEYIKKGLGLGAEKYLVKEDYEPEEIVKICLDYISR